MLIIYEYMNEYINYSTSMSCRLTCSYSCKLQIFVVTDIVHVRTYSMSTYFVTWTAQTKWPCVRTKYVRKSINRNIFACFFLFFRAFLRDIFRNKSERKTGIVGEMGTFNLIVLNF